MALWRRAGGVAENHQIIVTTRFWRPGFFWGFFWHTRGETERTDGSDGDGGDKRTKILKMQRKINTTLQDRGKDIVMKTGGENGEKRARQTEQEEEGEEGAEPGAYLTDNVVIVRQVLSVSLWGGRRRVAQFPYVWLRAVGRGGQGEAVRLRLAALGAVLTAGGRDREEVKGQQVFVCIELLCRQQPSGISPIHPDKLPWGRLIFQRA